MKKPILKRKGQYQAARKVPGKLFRLKFKTEHMEGVVATIEPDKKLETYIHEGEEVHILLEGRIEYVVGDETFVLEPGDVLWHRSDIPHGARNIGNTTAKYFTVGVPPTFM
ncbi:MAG: cupin domain-containing protein [Deltaproteobacteria bacterium]|nr:cupin domain-containing protein [Deltaproteobacteria bacterium]